MGTSLGLRTEISSQGSNTFMRMVGDSGNKAKWGASNPCPACSKNVYPSEQVFGADRKPWHRGCIRCSVMGCPNELYVGGFYQSPDGRLVCESCNEALFSPKSYGPRPAWRAWRRGGPG